jgi:hypothetical protein
MSPRIVVGLLFLTACSSQQPPGGQSAAGSPAGLGSAGIGGVATGGGTSNGGSGEVGGDSTMAGAPSGGEAPDPDPPEPEPWPTTKPSVSGIYPHLAMYNGHAECGTGAIVDWADRLWVITYAPHEPNGSTDKLYEVDGSLAQTIRPESIGGTPANRLIHRESEQLFIGPYAIDAKRSVRAVPYQRMPGRPTATARHLTDPAHKVYTMTMEEGLYELDVDSLAVTELYPDSNGGEGGTDLPGYHGKGGYSAQGFLIYSNNGEVGASSSPLTRAPAGALGAWDGNAWSLVERAQYTEVTGPGGIYGNDSTDDPLWAVGWDFRSLKLRLLEESVWHEYRLPKSSNSYDGRHGWHTEWPRIRAVDDLLGQDQLLMTMHGAFFEFPKGFGSKSSAGIRPLSSYLKILGDFEATRGWLIFGSDDSATNTFQDGPNPLVPQSHSNLWFVPPRLLSELGPREGSGGPWLKDDVLAGEPSLPYLFAGYDRRVLHLAHDASEPVTFKLEVDMGGTGEWQTLKSVTVPTAGYAYESFDAAVPGEWIRVSVDHSCKATAYFMYSSGEERSTEPAAIFNGLARDVATSSSAVVAPGSLASNQGSLRLAARDAQGTDLGYYELNADLELSAKVDATALADLKAKGSISSRGYEVDDASVIVTSQGKPWRLPKGDPTLAGFLHRGRREVVTERQLFDAYGTLYELPYDISGGIAKIRPIATHNLPIYDFASWRGLLVLTGTSTQAANADDPHLRVSADGKASVWLGAIDDLWQLGKPRGDGGPWHSSAVTAGVASDPYLFHGYDRRTLKLSHDSAESVSFTIELDITGESDWIVYQSLAVAPGQTLEHEFPPAFGARWLRLRTDRNASATAQLSYR